jgi:hypothetical protein
MSKDKDAAELSAERLAELIAINQTPDAFTRTWGADDINDTGTALRELQRLRAASAGSAWQPIGGKDGGK